LLRSGLIHGEMITAMASERGHRLLFILTGLFHRLMGLMD